MSRTFDVIVDSCILALAFGQVILATAQIAGAV